MSTEGANTVDWENAGSDIGGQIQQDFSGLMGDVGAELTVVKIEFGSDSTGDWFAKKITAGGKEIHSAENSTSPSAKELAKSCPSFTRSRTAAYMAQLYEMSGGPSWKQNIPFFSGGRNVCKDLGVGLDRDWETRATLCQLFC